MSEKYFYKQPESYSQTHYNVVPDVVAWFITIYIYMIMVTYTYILDGRIRD